MLLRDINQIYTISSKDLSESSPAARGVAPQHIALVYTGFFVTPLAKGRHKEKPPIVSG